MQLMLTIHEHILLRAKKLGHAIRHERNQLFLSRSRWEKVLGLGQKKKFGPGTTLPISSGESINVERTS